MIISWQNLEAKLFLRVFCLQADKTSLKTISCVCKHWHSICMYLKLSPLLGRRPQITYTINNGKNGFTLIKCRLKQGRIVSLYKRKTTFRVEVYSLNNLSKGVFLHQQESVIEEFNLRGPYIQLKNKNDGGISSTIWNIEENRCVASIESCVFTSLLSEYEAIVCKEEAGGERCIYIKDLRVESEEGFVLSNELIIGGCANEEFLTLTHQESDEKGQFFAVHKREEIRTDSAITIESKSYATCFFASRFFIMKSGDNYVVQERNDINNIIKKNGPLYIKTPWLCIVGNYIIFQEQKRLLCYHNYKLFPNINLDLGERTPLDFDGKNFLFKHADGTILLTQW